MTRVSAPRGSQPPDYEAVRVYGPFHRKTKDGVPAPELFKKIALSGELWGRGEKNSSLLAAMAHTGPLPAGGTGIEFFSLIEPSRPHGPQMAWHLPPWGQAREEDGWTKIEVVIRRASEDCI